MNLGLVFTRGVSLEQWVDLGLLDREKAIYELHLEKGHFKRVYWFTYGCNDNELASRLVKSGTINKNIIIVPMPKLFLGKIGINLYSIFMPVLKRKYLKNIDIIKTNQTDGGWSALFIKIIYRVPLLYRTGFTHSVFCKNEKKKRLLEIIKFTLCEKVLYKYCDMAVVSSLNDKKYVSSFYKINNNKVKVIYNYIDLNKFKFLPDIKKCDRFVSVVRLSQQKNLFNLVDGIKKIGIGLDIYGEGEEREELERYICNKNADVVLKGKVSNDYLPQILNKYKYFILVSYYEGMPKALLEAMACGNVCIGTDVQGINEVITKNITGYLAESTGTDAISNAILEALNDSKGGEIVENGITLIQHDYSLNSAVELENKVIRKIKKL